MGNLSIWIFFNKSYSNQEIYILLARLISNSAPAIDIKTGAHAAINGFKIPFTPRELEKKDKI